MSEHPPAGWYPDPANPSQQRYWDGAQWGVAENETAGTYQASTPQSAGYASSAAAATYSYAPSQRTGTMADAITTVKAAYWRIFGLLVAGFGMAIGILVVIGLLFASLVAGSISSGQLSVTALIGAFVVYAVGYLAFLALYPLIFGSILTVVRGAQQGQRIGVGESLRLMWPRVMRLLGLLVGVSFGSAVLFVVVSFLATAVPILGILLLLAYMVLMVGVGVAMTGFIAWVLTPETDG
jgi:hypothetical protein